MSDQLLPVLEPGLISVIIPAANVDHWLESALRSVLESVDADFEIIVSVNGSVVPHDWWPLSDARVRVLETPQRLGAPGATSRGLAAARGEYYAHLDADDLMHPERLSLQRRYLAEHPAAVLVGSLVDWVDDQDRVTGSFVLPTGPDVRPELARLNVVPHSAWMTRTSLVIELGGYDTAMPQMEDYDLLLRLASRGPIANLEQPLTQYRLHPGQLSRSVSPTGSYVRTILRRRLELSHALGLGRFRAVVSNCSWLGQQWLMFFGRRTIAAFRRVRPIKTSV